MATIGVNLKIDVTKLDKTKFIKGAKGTYCDLTAFINLDEKDQYENNGFIKQIATKEEKASGADKTSPILGNSRIFWTDRTSQQAPTAQQQAPSVPDFTSASVDDDCPF